MLQPKTRFIMITLFILAGLTSAYLAYMIIPQILAAPDHNSGKSKGAVVTILVLPLYFLYKGIRLLILKPTKEESGESLNKPSKPFIFIVGAFILLFSILIILPLVIN